MDVVYDGLKSFFETSTVHGLYYIGSVKSNLARVFWIIIVAIGFTIGFVLINDSFTAWEESPFLSTAQTRPISNARFPNITVCPPSGTNTVLNYDIANIKSFSWDYRE